MCIAISVDTALTSICSQTVATPNGTLNKILLQQGSKKYGTTAALVCCLFARSVQCHGLTSPSKGFRSSSGPNGDIQVVSWHACAQAQGLRSAPLSTLHLQHYTNPWFPDRLSCNASSCVAKPTSLKEVSLLGSSINRSLLGYVQTFILLKPTRACDVPCKCPLTIT